MEIDVEWILSGSILQESIGQLVLCGVHKKIDVSVGT
jgi:hypothetical protein